jgi:Flp pilus assembly protein protease CpaA
MRIDPLHVSPWLAGAVTGGGFAVLFGVLAGIASPDQWLVMVVGGLIVGTLLAVVIGLSLRDLQRRLAPVVVGLSRDQAREAFRRSGGGPVPAEPVIRQAALGIAERQLAALLRYQIFNRIFGAVLLVAIVFTELDGETQWWEPWPGVFVLLLTGWQLLERPRLMRRRIAALQAVGD